MTSIFIFPAQAEKASNPYYYDLSDIFDTSIFASAGDITKKWGVLDDNGGKYDGFSSSLTADGKVGGWNTYYSENSKKYLNAYDESTGILSYLKDDLNKGLYTEDYPNLEEYVEVDGNEKTSANISSDFIPFKLSDNLSVNGKNAFCFEGDSNNCDSVTVSGSGVSSNYIHILFAVGSNSTTRLPIVKLEFNDGTSSEHRFMLNWAREQGGWMHYCQKPNLTLSDGTVSVEEKEDINSMKLRAISIQTNGKSIKNITIKTHWSALVAITEIPFSESEYMALKENKVREAWNKAYNTPTVENIKPFLVYADEMEKNGISLSVIAEGAEIKTEYFRSIINKINPYYYDLQSVFNGSVVAEVGDEAEEWGISDEENRGGFSKKIIEGWQEKDSEKIINHSAEDFNRFGDSYDYSALPSCEEIKAEREFIPFKLSKELSFDGKNAFVFDNENNKRSVKISGSGVMSDYIFFAFAVNHSSLNVKIKLDFYDGTEALYKEIPLAWARDNGGSKYHCQMPELILSDGKIAEAAAVNNNSVKIRGIAIPTNGKRIKEITVSGGYTDHSQTALMAITETPLDYNELYNLAKNESVTKKADITADNVENVITSLKAWLELSDRGYYLAENTDTELYKELLSYAEHYGKADKNGLSFSSAVTDENKALTAEVTMVNTNINSQNYLILFASYKNGRLIKISINPPSYIEPQGLKKENISLEKTDGAVYKILILENSEYIKPIYSFII